MRHELPHTPTSNKKVAGMYYPYLAPTKWPVEAKAPVGCLPSTIYYF